LAKPNTFGNVDQLSLAAATVVFKLQIATSRQSLLEISFCSWRSTFWFYDFTKESFFSNAMQSKSQFLPRDAQHPRY